MLNALIQNGNQTAVLELPADPFTLQYELAQIGIRSRLRDIADCVRCCYVRRSRRDNSSITYL